MSYALRNRISAVVKARARGTCQGDTEQIRREEEEEEAAHSPQAYTMRRRKHIIVYQIQDKQKETRRRRACICLLLLILYAFTSSDTGPPERDTQTKKTQQDLQGEQKYRRTSFSH